MTTTFDHMCADTPGSEVARHPSAILFDNVFTAALPAVTTIAAHKNVPIDDDEHAAVLRHAMASVPHRMMRGVLSGDEQATFSLGVSISHSLDVLATMRLIALGRSVSRLPPLDGDALVLGAEETLRQRFANDKTLAMQVWGDPAGMMQDYVRVQLAKESQPAFVTLPGDASVRCTIRSAGGHRKASGVRS